MELTFYLVVMEGGFKTRKGKKQTEQRTNLDKQNRWIEDQPQSSNTPLHILVYPPYTSLCSFHLKIFPSKSLLWFKFCLRQVYILTGLGTLFSSHLSLYMLMRSLVPKSTDKHCDTVVKRIFSEFCYLFFSACGCICP